MLHAENRPFDLKVGDIIECMGPITALDSEKEWNWRKVRYKVTKIYPHIFMTEGIGVEEGVKERCFRKCDYICKSVSRVRNDSFNGK